MNIEINRNLFDLQAVCQGIREVSSDHHSEILAAIFDSCWSEDPKTGERKLDDQKVRYLAWDIKAFIKSDPQIKEIFKKRALITSK